MFYYLYKITNLTNCRYYIGVRTTTNINKPYWGSGIEIQKAIAEEGLQNFKKEILEYFQDAKSLYAREKEIVTLAFVKDPITYNMKVGGKGGFHPMPGFSSVKDVNGKTLRVKSDDPRLLSGELIGNTKNLEYYNNGISTFRLDPNKQDISNLTPGRLWSANDRKWFNDGVKSYFINPEEANGLIKGRLGIKNDTKKGCRYFNDGIKNYRIKPDSEKAKSLIPGTIKQNQKS